LTNPRKQEEEEDLYKQSDDQGRGHRSTIEVNDETTLPQPVDSKSKSAKRRERRRQNKKATATAVEAVEVVAITESDKELAEIQLSPSMETHKANMVVRTPPAARGILGPDQVVRTPGYDAMMDLLTSCVGDELDSEFQQARNRKQQAQQQVPISAGGSGAMRRLGW